MEMRIIMKMDGNHELFLGSQTKIKNYCHILYFVFQDMNLTQFHYMEILVTVSLQNLINHNNGGV